MYEMLENKFSTFSDAMWWGWGSFFECFTLYSHNICVKFSWRNFPSNIWNITVYFLFEALVSIWETTEASKQMLQLRDILYFRKASRFENVHYHLSMVGVYRKKIISINLFLGFTQITKCTIMLESRDWIIWCLFTIDLFYLHRKSIWLGKLKTIFF